MKRSRKLWCLALLLLPGCMTSGGREITVTAFGSTFTVIDKALPSAAGECDEYRIGLTPDALAFMRWWMADEQVCEAEEPVATEPD